jgi:hypothetical protein
VNVDSEVQCEPPQAHFSIAMQTEDFNDQFDATPNGVDILPELCEDSQTKAENTESSMKLESLSIKDMERISSDPDTIYRLKIQTLCRKQMCN